MLPSGEASQFPFDFGIPTMDVEGILGFLGAWGSFVLTGLVLLGFSVFFTLYYADPRDREPFAMLVTTLALTLCLTTVALFPVDIFLVSRIMDPTTGQRYGWVTDEAIEAMQVSVRNVYYVAYGLIASFCFFWIPLSYFYFEELDDEGQSAFQRLWASIKYTFFFVLVAGVLLLTGLFMTPARDHEEPKLPSDGNATLTVTTVGTHPIDLDWIRKMLDNLEDNPAGALAFLAGVMTVAGLGVVSFYTAPGLSLLPLHLLAGLKSLPDKVSDLHAELAANRQRQNSIMSRYGTTGGGQQQRQVSDRDRNAIGSLAQEEMVLFHRSKRAYAIRDSCFHQFQFVIRPLQILFGIAGVILSVLLVISVFLTCIDRLGSDVCGASCGYILTHLRIPNPLNFLFLKLSPYFPVDYLLMVMIILYLFWATTKGIISIGIRFLWVHLYQFRKAATPPQGLLAATMLLMFSIAGLGYSLIMSVAPEYSMFGSQKYCNNTIALGTRDCSSNQDAIIPCHIGAPLELCTPTVTSGLFFRIVIATPMLGVAFYYLQWAFLGMFLLALLVNLILGYRRGFSFDPLEEEDAAGLNHSDLEDREERSLLHAMNNRTSRESEEELARRRAGRRGQLYTPSGRSGAAGETESGLTGSSPPQDGQRYGAIPAGDGSGKGILGHRDRNRNGASSGARRFG